MLRIFSRIQRAALVRQGFSICEVRTPVCKVHVLEAIGGGHRPPLVLIHGLGSSATLFGPLLGRLRPYVRRLIVPDLPSHGLSGRPDPDVAQSAMAEAVFSTLDDRIEAPAVIFGNSLGGFMAAKYAYRSPERVKALILCSPGGAPLDAAELQTLRAVMRAGNYQEALAFVDRLGLADSPIRRLIALGVRKQLGAPHIQDFLARIDTEQFLSPEELRRLSMPILLQWGKGERILPRSSFEFFKENLPPHAVVEEPAGWGHSPYVQDLDGVVRCIVRFLDELVEQPG